jgi:DNA-3-methyladenine glycosylase I
MADAVVRRCAWSEGVDPAMQRYHDLEWGVPVRDDRRHFEFIVLESAQAGLSWWTILRKRDGYRRAFADFEPVKVARFDSRAVARLMQDSGIVRNRQKIEATIANARAFLEIQKEFGSFDTYVWPFVGGEPIVNRWRKQSEVPATTAESDALSKDLKARGFKFVGSTIVYAHMQATGLVDDHLLSCFRRAEANGKRADRAPRGVKAPRRRGS